MIVPMHAAYRNELMSNLPSSSYIQDKYNVCKSCIVYFLNLNVQLENILSDRKWIYLKF